MDQIVPPPNLYVEAIIFGDGEYKEAKKIKLSFKGRVLTSYD